MRCEVCHKSGMTGNNVSHSKRRTKTLFKANVHHQTVTPLWSPLGKGGLKGGNKLLKVKICTRCLRSLHRSPRRPVAVAGSSMPR